jgi:alkylation response protein AidB-like acyl-CoA dehydrogenase
MSLPGVVTLSPGRPRRTGPVPALPESVAEALAFAQGLELASAAELFETLATLAAHDLGVARAVEPHLDAVAILSQAGVAGPEGALGVFAAEGPGEPLHFADGVLNGTKPWCSLASELDGALVTATLEDGQRQLLAVSLRHPGVRAVPGVWHARGLAEIPSGPVEFTDVPAEPVGDPGWYLSRPGFAWGGVGVAACWYGGAVGVARTVFAAAVERPNPFLSMHLGAIDAHLEDARRALAEAAALIDAEEDGALFAKRARATVARVVEDVIARAGHALGPAPLALDATHAKRVADLALYVRQHHAEKDEASLGDKLLAGGSAPW